MNFGKKLMLTAVAVLAPVVMNAATVSSHPALSVGGLSFNDFTCSVTKGGFGAQPANCGQINVNTITQPGVGIEFSSGFTAYPLSFDDALIHYNVSSSDGGISSIGLGFNGNFYGLAIASVTESVYAGEKLVGFADVACSVIGCNRTENILLDGVYNNLHVIKDIKVSGLAGFSDISHVDQTFTTTPEPSTTALLGLGLVSASFFARRRAAKKAASAVA